MKLVEIINNTNKNYNKLKKSKENINTKLIALGGQNAINLADVPNKIQLLTNTLNKIAFGTYQSTKVKSKSTVNIPLNLKFMPTFLLFTLKSKNISAYKEPLYFEFSMSNEITNNKSVIYGNYRNVQLCRIDKIDNDLAKLYLIFKNDYDDFTIQGDWLAIG